MAGTCHTYGGRVDDIGVSWCNRLESKRRGRFTHLQVPLTVVLKERVYSQSIVLGTDVT